WTAASTAGRPAAVARPVARRGAAVQHGGHPRQGGQRPRAATGREERVTTTPAMEFIGQVEVAVGPPRRIGAGPGGERRIIPILGGRVGGPRLQGEVLPGGADYQLIRPDGVAEIEARYTLQLTDGALVYVVNRGIRHAAPEDMARLLRGEPVPAERVYFRTAPVFETAAPALQWLHRSLFLGLGERQPETVIIRIFSV
ncbi:DUF3237 domain-containing protein, partial [Paracraurococcus ruber]|uniref:DUF3237 domain-containing protein n=1 Tax=Paracraurococcus ruber TaxID=77675 RepID=UPI001F5B5778